MSAAPARTRITKTNNHHHTRSIIFLGLLVALSCCLMVLQRHATQPAQNNAGASGLLQPEAERGSAAQHVIGEGVAAAARAPAQTTVDAATGARLREQYGKLPLQFEANAGQTTAQEVKFLSRGSGYTLFLTPTEAVFSLSSLVGSKPAGKGNTRLAEKRLPSGNRGAAAHKTGQASAARRRQSAVLRMQLVGGNAGAQVSQAEELPGKVNYFPGNDPQKWRTDVSTYQKVQFEAVYPGIDMIYYGNQRQLEYDFIVAPDTDPGTIRLKFVGAQRMRVNEGGELVLKVKGGGEVKQHKPVIYQEVCGARTEVKGHYVLRERMEVGFEVAEYDTTKPLVIDPTIVYSTYLGGNDFEDANGIAVDSDGNAYVTGRTTSINFPRINALQPAFGGGDYDAFVTKLNAAGSALMYSTYLGGSDYDEAHDIAVDANGNAYVAGFTRSDNFPLANALQSAFGGGYTDAFVTKLNAAGSALMYSTYLGGSEYDEAPGIAVDANGNAYIAGYTESLNFPLANALQSTFSGFTDAFVTKLNAAGSALVYSTYLGGNYLDNAYGIAVDASGSAYVAGVTSSDNFPLADALQSAFSGFTDAFVTKLNAAGSALIYSTYLGGTEGDYAFGIAVDSDGNAYVTGFTRSDNFPLANALQSAYGGESDAFVTKLNAAGSALVYSTYLGGSDYDRAHGIAVDANGNAYVAGFTRSVNFPLANALQSAYGGGESDAFVTKLNAAGSALMYSTYFGGILDEGVNGIASSASGTYIVGSTNSYDFPTTQEALQNTGSSGDAFIARINENTNTTYYAIRGRITDILGNPVSAGGLIVTLSGTQNRTVTTSFDGTYFFPLLPGGGDYTVTPENTFTYTPSQRSYTRLAGNIADANFASENFTSKVRISGRVSNVNGRSLSATVRVSGDVTAEQNVNGSYSFLVPQGGTYTITAEKSPASFSPRTVANVTRDVNNVNFVVTAPLVSITGQLTNLPPDSINPQVNVSGTGLPSNPCDVSRQNGAVIYICAGLSVYGDYTVIPASQIYNFDPPVRGYQEIANNVFDANFAAQIGYTISGQVTGAGVGLGGVTVSLSGSASATAVTNASGNYTFPGLAAGGTYTVTPNNTALYSFTPQTVSNLQANQSLDFAGTLRTYTISGRITEGTNGLSSVLVTLTGPPGFTPRTFATQADGAYSFAGLSAGSNYTVQAARTNYTFTPASIAVINLLTDRAGANFAGTLQTFAISGRVMSGTSGLSGVTMTLSGGQTGTTQTDASGNYTFPNLAAGGTYTVTPTKTNYNFDPANRSFPNLSGNQTGNFAGALATFTISGQVTVGGTGLSGVIVNLSGGQASAVTTDQAGNYSFANLPAGSNYTLTPSRANYSFSPASVQVTNLSANQSNANFAATLLTYTISGRITLGGAALNAVNVALRGTQTANISTNASGDYSFTVAAGGSYTVTPSNANHSFAPSSTSFNNLSSNQTANFTASLIPAVFQFSAASYQVGEADGRVTVTITRTGDTSSAVMMDYQTTDSDTFTVGCADTVNNQGGAYARCDFATTVGALHFVAGETQKTIIVPIINDGYSESPETFQVRLSNAVGATLGTPNATTVTIQDNDGAGAPNPLTTMIPFFVRQQYLDFLSREPEAGEPWSGVMNRCADVNTGPTVNTDCDRIAVSAAFFGSPEFQLKGFYVFRFYKLAFNRLPQYLEIVPDMSFVAGATPEEVYARKAQLATQFTQRREFQTSYGQMSNADYVAALMNRYQLAQITTPDPAQPDGTTKLTLTASELVSRLDSSTLTRAQLFRAVADSDQVAQLEFNSAFVAVQYYGYLRRTPEETGYRNNLNALQRGVSFREMVNAFLNSVEYKLRFGQP